MPPGESLQITNFVWPDAWESTSGHTDRESTSGHTDHKIASGYTERDNCLVVKSVFYDCVHKGQIYVSIS